MKRTLLLKNSLLALRHSISFSQVRAKQEQQLKVRNFLPPQSQEPEIFLVGRDGGGYEGAGIIFGPDGRPMYPDGTYADEADGESGTGSDNLPIS